MMLKKSLLSWQEALNAVNSEQLISEQLISEQLISEQLISD